MKKLGSGLKGKILFPVIGVFIASITLILALVLTTTSSSIDDLSVDLLNETSNNAAGNLQAQVSAAMNSVKTLSLTVQEYAEPGSHNREAVISLFKKVLDQNDNIYGVYTLWEPNAFDHNDISYIGQQAHDSSGRFAPYVARGDSSVYYAEPLKEYDTAEYYQLPKTTGQECVTDPTAYKTNGKEMVMTSMVVPLFSNGKFVGIVGEDILVDTLVSEIKDTKLYDTGYVFAADSKGNIFWHPNSDAIGHPVYDYLGVEGSDAFKQAFANGSDVSFDTFSSMTNNVKRFVFNPIPVGTSTWWLASTTPVTEIRSATTHSLTFGIVAGVAACIAMAVFVILLVTRITKPINQLVTAADRLAEGDIDVSIDIQAKDEIGVLAGAFNRMIESTRSQAFAAERIADGDLSVDVLVRSEKDVLGKKLHELVERNNGVISNIAVAADQVAVGARQVSDSSMSLSQGATEQASSIEQLTASIEEISAQTKLNAENANQANLLAGTARDTAEQGNEQMKEMLKAMEDINASSTSISKIIKVIDDIAFQTNILALNAAVEAARAGQHGKGFAVVAEEVRNLAARSASAAKETTDMIENSIRKAEGGTKIANQAAQALGRIVTDVEKVAGLIGNIAVASNEQSMGIAQINQGVMQVSQVVQTNSATSEESAAASEELSGQAELLKEQVGRYRLKKDAHFAPKGEPEQLNPDVKRMLENMEQKGRAKPNKSKSNAKSPEKDAPHITLGGGEFGKYK